MLRQFAFLATAMAFLAAPQPGHSCGFIEGSGDVRTIREDAADCKIIILAQVANSQKDTLNGFSDLVILKTLKSHAGLDGKKVLRINRYIPIPDPTAPPRLVLFGGIWKGEADFFKGVPGDETLARYVERIVLLDPADRIKIMRYCFDYLDHQNNAIATDAFAEFIKSTDPDIRKAGRTLSADKLRLWLQDENTPRDRLRLYAFLLASCGNQQDAALLRKLVEQWAPKESAPLLDGVFTAYTLLDQKSGWGFTKDILKDTSKTFLLRYSALRAARYFFMTQPEFMPEQEIIAAFRTSLDQSDMADFPVEYLRQMKNWKLTDEVLALPQKKGFETPLIRRMVLRYALQCPEARAVQFVADARKIDPLYVEQAEEALQYEGVPKVSSR